MRWLYLGIAIILEILGTSLLKLSNGNEKWHISVLAIVFYALCFLFLAKALKYMEIATAYAIWSGVGIAATAFMGFLFFKESVTLMKVICILLILVGVIGLNLLAEEK